MTDKTGSESPAKPEIEIPPAAAADAEYVLRLYVSGQTPRSILAIENMRRICAEHLSERYTLEIIDIICIRRHARRSRSSPCPHCSRFSPHPLRRIIGDLSNTEKC